MEKNLQNKEALTKLKKLAEDIKFCMLATSDTKDNLYGRPMTTMQVDEDGSIWFFTSENTGAGQEAKKEEKVCLNYADPSKSEYLTVQGSIDLVKDKKKMEELWNPILKAYFPKGLEEPNIALLKVTAEQAHYWDTASSKLVTLFSFIKSSLTGETADLGNTGELAIH